MTTDNWPAGTVTFLFADIEDSTPLWDRHRSAMRPALAEHDTLLKTAVESNGGVIVKSTGDGAMAAFASPSSALAAALEAQRALQEATWPTIAPDKIRARMGLHSGEAELRDGDYYGTAVNRAARLMSTGHGGQILVSGTTARLIEGGIAEGITLIDLGQHRLKGLARPAHVFQVQTTGLPGDFPPLRTTEAAKDNLPQPLTSFVGREVELKQLDRFFAGPDARLVTLLGPGGMGKTQLAIEWASKQAQTDPGRQARYPDGVHFVDLAPLESPDQVAPAIAEVFTFPLQGERRSPEQQMLDYLREKNMLLILDNFESVSEASAFVNDILLAARGVRILATSRERLHLKPEQVYAIEGLTCPPASLPGDANLNAYTAVQLFASSARRARPDFELTPEVREPVGRICRITGGMPLAIELAAAWIDLLPAATIADEIEQRLDVLETDLHDLPERHRSIHAAIDTTWEYLDADERQTFARLSIFRGGFSREAATAVLGHEYSKMALVRMLSKLQDKSLLGYDAAAERFTIHELLRHYGAEKLRTASQEEEYFTVQEKHALYYARLLASCEPGLKSAQFVESLHLIETDLENMLLAWDWLVEKERRPELAAMMDSLGLFHEMRGYLSIGQRNFNLAAARWVERLAELENGPSEEVAGELKFLAKIEAWQSVFELDLREAESLLLRSLASLDDARLDEGQGNAGRAFATYRLGLLLRESQVRRAIKYLNQSLSLYQGLGDLWGVANCLLRLGVANTYTRLETSRRYHLQASEVFEKSDDMRGLGLALGSLSLVAALQGDDEAMESAFSRYLALVDLMEQAGLIEEIMTINAVTSEARGHFAQATSYRKELLDYREDLGRDVLMAKVSLAFDCLHSNQFDRGRALLRQALPELEQTAVENDYRLAWCFHVLAMLALAEDEFDKALDYLKEALAIYRSGNSLTNVAGANALSAVALSGMGDLGSARPLLVSGLESALEHRGILPLGESLLGIALLMAHLGEIRQARKLYELVWRLPRFQKSALFDGIAGKRIRAQTADLSPDELKAIAEEAAELDIWQEAAGLLDQLL